MHNKLWPCLVGKMVRWNNGSWGFSKDFQGFHIQLDGDRNPSRLSHVPGLGEAWERVGVGRILDFTGFFRARWWMIFWTGFCGSCERFIGFLLQSFLSRRWVLNFTASQVFSQELKGFFVSHVAVGGWRLVFVGPFFLCSMPLAALGGWSLANANHDKWRPLKCI